VLQESFKEKCAALLFVDAGRFLWRQFLLAQLRTIHTGKYCHLSHGFDEFTTPRLGAAIEKSQRRSAPAM
jgi:hypothetical protein